MQFFLPKLSSRLEPASTARLAEVLTSKLVDGIYARFHFLSSNSPNAAQDLFQSTESDRFGAEAVKINKHSASYVIVPSFRL